jgi:hypothetical protein
VQSDIQTSEEFSELARSSSVMSVNLWDLLAFLYDGFGIMLEYDVSRSPATPKQAEGRQMTKNGPWPPRTEASTTTPAQVIYLPLAR